MQLKTKWLILLKPYIKLQMQEASYIGHLENSWFTEYISFILLRQAISTNLEA